MGVCAGRAGGSGGAGRVKGIDVAVDSVARRRLIGYLPENNPLYEEMMVLDFLEFVAQVRGVPDSEQRARIKSAVERCGLHNMAGKKIGQLSKGLRDGVALAPALLPEPALPVPDRPTC